MPENAFSPIIIGSLTYNGLLIMMAAAVTLIAACVFVTKRGTMDFRQLLLASPFALFFGFIGSRIFYVSFNDALFLDFRDKLSLTDGGYALFGAFIGVGGAIAVYFALAHRKKLILPALDAVALGGALGIAIGRWGNLINEECYGEFITSPALQGFPFSVYISTFDEYCMALFFLESLLCLLIFAALLFAARRYEDRPGAVFFHFLALYCGIRVLIESMRQDSMYIGFVRVSQVAAALTLIVLFSVIMVKKSKIAGFHLPDLLGTVLFVAVIGGGFWAEFYMGSESRTGNLVLLAVMCMLLIVILVLLYAIYRNTVIRVQAREKKRQGQGRRQPVRTPQAPLKKGGTPAVKKQPERTSRAPRRRQ